MKSILCAAIFFTVFLSDVTSAQQPPKPVKPEVTKKTSTPTAAKNEPVKPGDTVPMFALKEFGGDFIFLKHYCGKNKKDTPVRAVLLDFFATDCLACVAKIGELQAVAGKHAPGLKTFLISIDSKPEKTLPAFLKDKKVDLTVLTDIYRKTLYNYGFNTVPQTVLIDGDCKAVYVTKKEDKDYSPIADHLDVLLK